MNAISATVPAILAALSNKHNSVGPFTHLTASEKFRQIVAKRDEVNNAKCRNALDEEHKNKG